MVAPRDRITGPINEYIGRRIAPLEQDVARANAEIAALRAELREARESLQTLADSILGTVNAVSRRSPHRDRIRCLFLVHYMEAWDSIADVYEQMREAEDFEPIVASIHRRLVGAGEFEQEELTHQRLSALGIPHIRLDSPDSFLDLEVVKQLDPDLIIRQSQWEPDVPPAFATEHLAFARLALIPYEAMTLIDSTPPPAGMHDWATDSRYHRNCWAVFCANEYSREKAVRTSPATNGAQCVVTGHPKIERLRRALEESEPQDRPFTVVWSAHHSLDENWSRFGMFHLTKQAMADWAESRPESRFVFSPHPSLTTSMDAAIPPLDEHTVSAFRTRWASLPNTETFTGDAGGGYGSLFAQSDVMVTDGLSMLLEYQIANKPVVYLEREGHRPFNVIGEIARRGFHSVATVDEARDLVDRFAAGEPDPLAQAQREVVDELFGDHQPAREIVEYIRDNWDKH